MESVTQVTKETQMERIRSICRESFSVSKIGIEEVY